MTRARNISNPQAITLPLTVSANITTNAAIVVGNSTINTSIDNYSVNILVANGTSNTSIVASNGAVTVGQTNSTANAYVTMGADGNGYGKLEMGGSIGGYIDLKSPFSDDYDFRIAGSNTALSFQNTSTSMLSMYSNGQIFVNGAVTFANSTGNTFNMSSDGRIGVGTINDSIPSGVRFVVKDYSSNDGTDNIGIQYRGTSGAHTSGINWYDFRGQNNARICNDLQDDGAGLATAHLRFNTSNAGTLSTKMLIAANGKIGIANSSPSNTLHITGTLYTSGNTELGGSSSRNVIGYLHEGHGSPTLGAGIRELFRVGSWSLSSSGFFSLAYTRGNVVHNSMWTWVCNHAGRAQLFNLASATYTNTTIYADDDYYGSVIISVDHGAGTDQNVEYTVTTYVGSLNMGNVNTQWTSNAANYYRTSRGTSTYSMSIPNLVVSGSVSKGSGTFDIKHPLDENKRLRHSFIEGPRYDLIYRGRVQLTNGQAIVNIDTDSVSEGGQTMTNGTFTALTRNPSTWLQNETSWSKLKCTLEENILTINCEDEQSSDFVNWMVMAERKDEHILIESDQSDSQGRMILEYDPKAIPVLSNNYVYPADKVVSPGE